MTTNPDLPFNKFGRDVFSQNGEDGVLEELCRRLNIGNSNSWCVEFGAWDGKHLSNTFNLVNNGWNAIYIEGNAERFDALLLTAAEFNGIYAINAFVDYDPSSNLSLSNILKDTPIPSDFEILSIDIDSNDLDVWERVNLYNPKIVVLEINSSALPGILWRHTPKTPGNTFSAAVNVARQKKYTPVCHTGNLIFVRNDLVGLLNMDERYVTYPELLFITDWLP